LKGGRFAALADIPDASLILYVLQICCIFHPIMAAIRWNESSPSAGSRAFFFGTGYEWSILLRSADFPRKVKIWPPAEPQH
jgi:hypothetical protein